MKAIVLAGGKGTRLAPYNQILPKPLMPIGDMPILEVLLRQMKCSGINHVVLTVGHLSHLLQSYFQDGSRYDLDIQYSLEEEPLGTAGPLSMIDDLGDTFLVTNGDVLTTLDIRELMEYHKKCRAITTIAMHERKVKIDLGVIELDGDNRIQGYIEKPSIDYRVSMGMYVFEPHVLDYIPRGEYLDFPDLVHKLLEHGQHVEGYPFDGYWRDLGNQEDYQEAQEDFGHMREQILGACQ